MPYQPDGPLQFTLDPHGQPTAVTLEVRAYIALLIQANVTDPDLWPPGFKDKASSLARIREIESDCVAQHGEFDWERLSLALQDEYDSLCATLDSLQDGGERASWEVYKSEPRENDR